MIFNYACRLHQYIMNREPAQFETVQFLVDRSHWQSNIKKSFNLQNILLCNTLHMLERGNTIDLNVFFTFRLFLFILPFNFFPLERTFLAGK